MTKTVRSCIFQGMDLEAFLERVGSSGPELAAEIGVAGTTIWRIRQGRVIPKTSTVLAILRWAEAKAREQRLPVRDRLTFEGLVGARAA